MSAVENRSFENVCKRWRCRKKQIEQLMGLLHPSRVGSCFIAVHGPSGSGKTAITRACLEAVNACTTDLGPLELRSSVHNVWAHICQGWLSTLGEGNIAKGKLDGFLDAQAIISKLESRGRRLCVVADWQDAALDSEQLPAILELVSQARRPLDLIVLSAEPLGSPHMSATLISGHAWHAVHFPPYTQEELLVLTSAKRPPDISEPVYNSFLHCFVRPAIHAALTLLELRSMIRELVPHLRSAIAAAGATATPAQIIQRMQAGAEAQCSRAVRCELPRPLDIQRLDWSQPFAYQAHTAQAAQQQLSLDVPYFSKFLLLAAFLAGVNQRTADHKLFSMAGGGRGKRRKDTQAMDRQVEAAKEQALSEGQAAGGAICLLLTQPACDDIVQTFGLERWLQIFWQLIASSESESEAAAAPRWRQGQLLSDVQSAALLHQVRHLVAVRLITHVSGDILQSAKFVSCITEELAQGLARNVQLELRKFMLYV